MAEAERSLDTMAKIVTTYQCLQLGITHPIQNRHLCQRALDRLIDADWIFNIVADGYQLPDFSPAAFRI